MDSIGKDIPDGEGRRTKNFERRSVAYISRIDMDIHGTFELKCDNQRSAFRHNGQAESKQTRSRHQDCLEVAAHNLSAAKLRKRRSPTRCKTTSKSQAVFVVHNSIHQALGALSYQMEPA